MTVLGLDGSGPVLAVGVLQHGVPVVDVRLARLHLHSRVLVRAVHDALRDAGVPPRALDLVAVGAGPGSYTGLRLAATVAKVLAWAAGARVAGVDSLQVRAAGACASLPSGAVPAGTWMAALLPARRGQVYGRLYRPGWPPQAAGPLEEGPARPVAARLLARARELGVPGVLFVGEGAQEYASLVREEGGFLPADAAVHLPQGVLVARLGLEEAASGAAQDPVSFVPRYAGPPPVHTPPAR